MDEIDTMPSRFYSALRIPQLQTLSNEPRFRRVFERVGLPPDVS